MKLKDLWYWSDSLFFLWLFFIIFSRYLVNPSQFYPSEFNSFLFSNVSFLGLSATPRIFWIGLFLLSVSVSLRAAGFAASSLSFLWRGKSLPFSLKSEGEQYLEKHGIRRVED